MSIYDVYTPPRRYTMVKKQKQKQGESPPPDLSHLPVEVQHRILEAYIRIEPLQVQDGKVYHPLLPPMPVVTRRYILPRIYEDEENFFEDESDDEEDEIYDEDEDDRFRPDFEETTDHDQHQATEPSEMPSQICQILLKNTPYISVCNSSHWPPLQIDTKSPLDLLSFLARHSDASTRSRLRLHITCTYDATETRVCCRKSAHTSCRSDQCLECDKSVDVMEVVWHAYFLGLGLQQKNVTIKLLESRDARKPGRNYQHEDEQWSLGHEVRGIEGSRSHRERRIRREQAFAAAYCLERRTVLRSDRHQGRFRSSPGLPASEPSPRPHGPMKYWAFGDSDLANDESRIPVQRQGLMQ